MADRLLPPKTRTNHFFPNHLFHILFLAFRKYATSPDLFHKDITEKLPNNIRNQFLSNSNTQQIKLCTSPSLLNAMISIQRTLTNEDTF